MYVYISYVCLPHTITYTAYFGY